MMWSRKWPKWGFCSFSPNVGAGAGPRQYLGHSLPDRQGTEGGGKGNRKGTSNWVVSAVDQALNQSLLFLYS